MRQPKHFLIGNITKRLMRFGNLAMVPDCVERLNVNHGDVVVEVGSGNGQAIDEILLKGPQKVFAFEISKTFLADLRSKFSNNPKVKILDQDAKQSENVIETKSVDAANANTSYQVAFDRPAFNAGEILGISIDPTNQPNDVNITCIFLFDWAAV